jgi:hypothetical protein
MFVPHLALDPARFEQADLQSRSALAKPGEHVVAPSAPQLNRAGSPATTHPASVFAACRVSDWTLRSLFLQALVHRCVKISACSFMCSARSTAASMRTLLAANLFWCL